VENENELYAFTFTTFLSAASVIKTTPAAPITQISLHKTKLYEILHP
jgi:hypothetical protein